MKSRATELAAPKMAASVIIVARYPTRWRSALPSSGKNVPPAAAPENMIPVARPLRALNHSYRIVAQGRYNAPETG